MMNGLTKDNFTSETKEGVCLVAVGAPWCPDCKKIEPIMGILMQEYAGKVKFCMVMADEQEELKEQLNVRRIPTLIFFKDGVEVGERLVEPNSKPMIEDALKKALKA